MADLYLFTTAFPFGKGENFLEQEVPYLARHFDALTIVPTRRVDPAGPSRALPPNVRLDLALAGEQRDVKATEASAYKAWATAVEFRNRPRTATSHSDLQRLWFYLRMAVRARRWLRAQQAHQSNDRMILYTYWLDGTTFGLATARGSNATLVSRVHNGDLYEEKHESGYLPLHRATIARLDRLFPVSEHGRAYLTERWPELSPRITVDRLGVPDPDTTTSASKDGVFRIVSCSHINPVKRLPLIIDGIAAYAARHPDQHIQWRHIGDGAAREELAQRAERTLPDHVDGRFLGRVPPGGVIDHYRHHAVDAFVNVSSTEGVPVSIMEAQSCGIPVIATAVGGTPEIVNNENGVLLDADPTADDLADALAIVRSDDGGRRRASKKTWNTMSRAEVVYPRFAETIAGIDPKA